MVAALTALGCGRKLPPLPPVLDVPARIEPLQLSQEGADVVLRFPYPTRTATGEELWRHRLPFTGNATPMTYRLGPDGRQFVVIASGGHVWSEPGDALMAFALPR